MHLSYLGTCLYIPSSYHVNAWLFRSRQNPSSIYYSRLWRRDTCRTTAWGNIQHGPRASQKIKNVCAYSPRTCFVAADHWFLVYSVMFKSASCSCKTGSLMSKATMMKTWRMLSWPGWIARRPHGMTKLYTNWCQGTTSALMSKATVWKSRQRYVPQLGYSISVLLLLMYILVWQKFVTLWTAFVVLHLFVQA